MVREARGNALRKLIKTTVSGQFQPQATQPARWSQISEFAILPGTMPNDHTRRVYDSIIGLLSSEENPTPLGPGSIGSCLSSTPRSMPSSSGTTPSVL